MRQLRAQRGAGLPSVARRFLASDTNTPLMQTDAQSILNSKFPMGDIFDSVILNRLTARCILNSKQGSWIESNAAYCIEEDFTLQECSATMAKNGIGALMVKDVTGDLAGIISERDCVKALAAVPKTDPHRARVADWMTPATKIVTVEPTDPMSTIMELMRKYRIRHLPVVKNGPLTNSKAQMVGMLSIKDLLVSVLKHK